MSEQPPIRGDLAANRAFFASRAATWEERFPDDDPVYRWAVGRLNLPVGASVLDAACGTGRALPMLREAVGPAGRVLAVDLTPEMLAEVRRRGRGQVAAIVLADVGRLPLAAGGLDGIFAAGFLPHVPDPVAGLGELARVCRPGATLALFHPVGRATLAARHGRPADGDPDDIRAEANIRAALARAGWAATSVDDGPDHYLVVAARAG